jgi:hypothetical protein
MTDPVNFPAIRTDPADLPLIRERIRDALEAMCDFRDACSDVRLFILGGHPVADDPIYAAELGLPPGTEIGDTTMEVDEFLGGFAFFEERLDDDAWVDDLIRRIQAAHAGVLITEGNGRAGVFQPPPDGPTRGRPAGGAEGGQAG